MRNREKKEEEEDELLDFKKHSIFIDVLKKLYLKPEFLDSTIIPRCWGKKTPNKSAQQKKIEEASNNRLGVLKEAHSTMPSSRSRAVSAQIR